MKIDCFLNSHLSGEKFSDYQAFDLSSSEKTYSRLKTIESLVAGKRVLHIGCCDHLPFIDDKLKNGQWMHKIITDATEVCLGIDIDKTALEYVKNNLGYTNVQYADILSGESESIKNESWDYAVLGEILEHVDNPVQFLSAIKDQYQGCIKQIVVSVPNAFSYRNVVNVSQGIEKINTDHRYWFTPFTLAKVLHLSGLDVEKVLYADAGYKRVRPLKYLFVKREKVYLDPWYADTLIGIGEL